MTGCASDQLVTSDFCTILGDLVDEAGTMPIMLLAEEYEALSENSELQILDVNASYAVNCIDEEE